MLGYYDSYFGLVPVRITSVERNGAQWSICATVTCKKKRGIYGAGYKIVSNELHIVPRDAIKRSKYNTWILPYDPKVAYAEYLKKDD